MFSCNFIIKLGCTLQVLFARVEEEEEEGGNSLIKWLGDERVVDRVDRNINKEAKY